MRGHSVVAGADRTHPTMGRQMDQFAIWAHGIFDTFADESAREAHINGDIAKALFSKAKELFTKEPEIDKPMILAAKAPGA